MAQLPSSVQLSLPSSLTLLPSLGSERGAGVGAGSGVRWEQGRRVLSGEARRGRERASVAGELERGGGGFREWPVSKC